MEEKNINVSDGEDHSLRNLIVDVKRIWSYLWSKWLQILIVGLVGGIIGLFVSLWQEPKYEARLTFVLEEDKGGSMGNLGGLAAMAGINLGSAGGGLFQGENILDLYKSRRMISQTLLSTTTANDSLLIDRYLNFSGLRENWANDGANQHLANLDFSIPQAQFSLQHDSIMGIIVTDIQKNQLKVSRPDRQKSLVEVIVSGKNEHFSKDFTEVLVREVNDFYVYTKTGKAQKNVAILEKQVDSVRRELDASLAGVAVSMDANPNPNMARSVLSVGSSRRQVDVHANQAILTELVRNQELAKVTLRNETPLIQVVDHPILPLEKVYLSKIKGVIIGGLIAGFLIVAFFIVKRFYMIIMGE